MITLEIAFNSDGTAAPFSSEQLGFEFSAVMKSDKSPSRWEDEIFSKLSGNIVHVFDKDFTGKQGYRALYDDVIDELSCIKFNDNYFHEFERLLVSCLASSNDGWIYVCTDCQFGDNKETVETTNLCTFLEMIRLHGLSVNSCTKIKR